MERRRTAAIFISRKEGEMPEDVTPTETVEEPKVEAPEAQEVEEFDKERAMATIEKLRQFEKDAKKYAKQIEQFEKAEKERKQAEMSEMERLKTQLEEAQTAVKTYELRARQQEAAQAAGLPLEFAARLKGETPEELEADAKKLAELLPKKSAPQISPTSPGGAKPESEDERIRKLRTRNQPIWRQGGGVNFPKTGDK